jgi:hypothetical protein
MIITMFLNVRIMVTTEKVDSGLSHPKNVAAQPKFSYRK